MKICIIPPFNLPVPSVKGGAVEEIITWIIDENEINKKFDITLFSVYNKEAKKIGDNYKNTNLIYIHYSTFLDKTFQKIIIYLKKIFRIDISIHLFTLFIYFKIKKEINDYEFILIESGDPYLTFFEKIIDKNKIIAHMHGHMHGTPEMNEKFGRFIAISNYIKDYFLLNSKIDSNKVFVLKNCVDSCFFENHKDKNFYFDKYCIPRDSKVILFCGRIIPEKGIEELLDAFNLLNNHNIYLVIIGTSNFGKKIVTDFEENIQKKIEVNRNVLYLGFIKNTLLPIYFQNADFVIMPSTWEEPAGLVAIEAIVSETILITTQSGGIPEYVGNAAIFIDKKNIKNELLDLFENEKISKYDLEQLKRNMKEIKESFNTSKYYNSIFDYLIDARNKN